jgi:hypothetical protein
MSKTSTLKNSILNSELRKSSMKPQHGEIGPSDKVISAILNYSKALSVQKSKHLKHVEIILN